MTILSVVQKAALYLGLEVPATFYTNTGRTWQEMQVIVSDCVSEVLMEYDWQAVKKIATITGDGVQTEFDMPADYGRMVRDAHMWTNFFVFWPGVQVQSVDSWLAMEEVGFFATPVPMWIIFGNKFHIRPALGSGETLRYFYISNFVVKNAGSDIGTNSGFTLDTQSFVLDEDLLRLCIVYNWKMRNGQDYASDLQAYEDHKSYLIGQDKGPRVIVEGRSQRMGAFGNWPFAGQWR